MTKKILATILSAILIPTFSLRSWAEIGAPDELRSHANEKPAAIGASDFNPRDESAPMRGSGSMASNTTNTRDELSIGKAVGANNSAQGLKIESEQGRGETTYVVTGNASNFKAGVGGSANGAGEKTVRVTVDNNSGQVTAINGKPVDKPMASTKESASKSAAAKGGSESGSGPLTSTQARYGLTKPVEQGSGKGSIVELTTDADGNQSATVTTRSFEGLSDGLKAKVIAHMESQGMGDEIAAIQTQDSGGKATTKLVINITDLTKTANGKIDGNVASVEGRRIPGLTRISDRRELANREKYGGETRHSREIAARKANGGETPVAKSEPSKGGETAAVDQPAAPNSVPVAKQEVPASPASPTAKVADAINKVAPLLPVGAPVIGPIAGAVAGIAKAASAVSGLATPAVTANQPAPSAPAASGAPKPGTPTAIPGTVGAGGASAPNRPSVPTPASASVLPGGRGGQTQAQPTTVSQPTAGGLSGGFIKPPSQMTPEEFRKFEDDLLK